LISDQHSIVIHVLLFCSLHNHVPDSQKHQRVMRLTCESSSASDHLFHNVFQNTFGTLKSRRCGLCFVVLLIFSRQRTWCSYRLQDECEESRKERNACVFIVDKRCGCRVNTGD